MRAAPQSVSQASPHHRRWVRRETILWTLERHIDTRIVLFAAPAGFGKSTTMAQWAAEVARHGRLTAWLSCEAMDNEEGAFLSHLVGALRHLVQSPAELDLAFQSSPIPQLDVVLAALVAGLAAREADISLFFEDYHAVEAPAVKRYMEHLTRQAPAKVAFVIGSRSLPDLQLGKLRVLGDVSEIGPDDLRFASSEAEAFFHEKLGLSVSSGTVETLCSRTEGWAAAGTYAPQPYWMALDNPVNKKFISSFREKFGQEKMVNGIGEAGYNGLHLYALAAEKAGSLKDDDVLAALPSMSSTRRKARSASTPPTTTRCAIPMQGGHRWHRLPDRQGFRHHRAGNALLRGLGASAPKQSRRRHCCRRQGAWGAGSRSRNSSTSTLMFSE